MASVLLAGVLASCGGGASSSQSSSASSSATTTSETETSADASSSEADSSSETTTSTETSSKEEISSKESSSSETYSSEDASSEEGTSSEEESSSEEISSSEEESLWTPDQLALFETYVYGIDIPYPDFEFTMSYNERADLIVGISTSDQLNKDDLDTYAMWFEEGDWIEQTAGKGIRYFELPVETEAGTRYPSIVMAIIDEKGSVVTSATGKGNLVFQISDPNTYGWQTDLIASVVDYLAEGSTTVIPAYEEGVKYYQINVDYLSTSGYAAIFCVTDDPDPVATYSAILTNANWTVADEPNDYGYIEAVSPNEDIKLEYLKDSAGLAIYVQAYVPVLSAWPEEEVAAFVTAIAGNTTTVIPALEGASEYLTMDYLSNYGYACVAAYGEESLLTAYYGVLAEAGWTVANEANSYGYIEAISPNGDIMLELAYNEEHGAILIYIEAVPEEVPWPADIIAEIVESLAPGSTTVIPEFEGGSNFDTSYVEIYLSYYGIGYFCFDGDEEMVEDYIAVLLENGWTPNDTGDGYVSPNKDIVVDVYYDDAYFDIEFNIYAYVAPVAEWPADDIAELLGEKVTDTLPEYTGESSGFTILDDAWGTAVMVSVEEGTEDEAIAAYEATLIAAGYTAVEEAEHTFNSPNGQIIVEVYMGTPGSFTIAFEVDPFIDTVPFPANELAEFISTYELGLTVTSLPDPAGNGFIIQSGTSSGYHYFSLTVAGNALSEMLEALDPILTAAGYALDNDYSTDTVKYYENEDYHAVDIRYIASTDTTRVSFWE